MLCLLIILAGMKIMVVQDIKEVNSMSMYVQKGDLIIAVNGKCISLIPPEKSMKDWIEVFKSASTPKLCTLFRIHPSYSFSYNPLNVIPCYRSLIM